MFTSICGKQPVPIIVNFMVNIRSGFGGWMVQRRCGAAQDKGMAGIQLCSTPVWAAVTVITVVVVLRWHRSLAGEHLAWRAALSFEWR